MKTAKYTLLIMLVLVGFAPLTETKAQSVSVSVNFNTFQQELSPYGRWINNPRFGQVWIYNDINFKPYYTDGHWEYTNYGWSWISDYDWGWAPFHYGRWEEDPYYGWMWIPGYEWAPAWVSWSSCDDYYGWAPLGYGININVSFGSIAANRWNFIPRRNICDRDVYRYCVPYGRNNNFRNAVVINNYYGGDGAVGRYVRGPERREAERYTRNRIEERRVNYTDRSWSRGNNTRNRNENNGYGYGNRNNEDANRNRDYNNGNNRRRNDMNTGNETTASEQPERRRQRDASNPPQTADNNWRGNRQNDNGTQNNGNGNGNYPRRRDINENGNNNNSTPAADNRRPGREVNADQQTNENNRWNRNNDQQHNNQQQNQRQWQQRPAPQPQQPPAAEQRSMERRNDNMNNGSSRGNWQGGGGRRNG